MSLLSLPRDLTVSGQPVHVTRVGTDATVYHKLRSEDGALVRASEDLPAPGMAFTEDTTEADITAVIASDIATR